MGAWVGVVVVVVGAACVDDVLPPSLPLSGPLVRLGPALAVA